MLWGTGVPSPLSEKKQYQAPFTPWRLDLLGVVWDGRVQPYVWYVVPGSLYALTYLVLCGTGVSSPMSGKQYQVPFTAWRLDLLGIVWDRRVQPYVWEAVPGSLDLSGAVWDGRVQHYVWEAVPGSLYALKTRLTWCCMGQACPALCLGSSTRFPFHREE